MEIMSQKRSLIRNRYELFALSSTLFLTRFEKKEKEKKTTEIVNI